MSNYGSAGMPKVVVLGGSSHSVYYNVNNNQINLNGVQTAINNALAAAVTPTWNCNNGVCSDPGTGTGAYTSLTACQANCIQTSIFIESIEKLTIYPNPTKDIFIIKFKSLVVQDIKLNIVNSIGELIFSENIARHIGDYNKNIDLKDNAKGIYFLEIETDEGIINKKLILQ